MFDIKRFSNILQKIANTYTSISDFAEKSEVNRTYLSKYINMKLDSPPTPKILEKIANSSNGIATYKELMLICDYIDDELNENEQIEDPLGLAKIGFSMKDYTPPTEEQKVQIAELIKVILKDNKKNT